MNSALVDAELARAVTSDVEEQEAENHRQLTLVHDREEAVRGVVVEIGDGHLPAGNKGGKAGKQSQHDEDTSAKLDNARRQHERNVERGGSAECAEEFLRAVAQKKKSGNDTQGCIGIRFKAAEEFHGIKVAPIEGIVAAESKCEPFVCRGPWMTNKAFELMQR